MCGEMELFVVLLWVTGLMLCMTELMLCIKDLVLHIYANLMLRMADFGLNWDKLDNMMTGSAHGTRTQKITLICS